MILLYCLCPLARMMGNRTRQYFPSIDQLCIVTPYSASVMLPTGTIDPVCTFHLAIQFIHSFCMLLQWEANSLHCKSVHAAELPFAQEFVW